MSTPGSTTGSFQLVEAFVEGLDGAPVGERRRWSDEFKAQAVTGALEPGITVPALARRLGISPPQLFGWRRTLLNRQKEDAAPGAPGAAVPLVEIVVGDVIIRVAPDPGDAALRRLIGAVRSA